MSEINIRCFDVASPVVKEATKQFGSLWELNPESYDIFKQYCSAIDAMAEEFGGESFEVEVDDTKMTVSISLECFDMQLYNTKHNFYQLTERALKFNFYSSKDNNLVVKFTFPSLWERAV